jgi:hypothetical protein
MARECWAKALGNCGGGMSREHAMSKCVYPEQTVFVSGFDFCKSGPKEIHINSLTAKILCRNHNSQLGEQVDSAGGELFNAIREFTKRRQDQSDFPKLKWLPIQYKLNARLLERWFLKVMLGIAFRGKLIIGPGDTPPGTVPLWLVRAAFGMEALSPGQGMYVAFRINERVQLEDRFRYTAKTIGANLLMGDFLIHGLRFYLNLQPTNGAVYTSIEGSDVFYRRAEYIESSADSASPHAQTIEFLIRKPNLYTQKLSIQ